MQKISGISKKAATTKKSEKEINFSGLKRSENKIKKYEVAL